MPTHVARVKELFVAVMEMSAAERAAYLDTACGGDTALRQQIEVMLRSHENSGELLSLDSSDMLQDGGSTDADVTSAFPRRASPSATMHEPPAGEPDDLRFLTAAARPGLLGQLGPYEVQTLLGRGGFGLVLKGFDERLHRVVAIKVLAPAYSASGAARARFLREARAAAAVKNEHVVGIHDVQGDADPPYLVMEYVEGVSLQDKIDRHGAISVKEILRIGMQIAEGLAAAHKQGLVHRDIKPANILLENGVERVKITDFGLARAVDDASVTQSGTVAGTPMYMSPEQAEGLAIDHRSDLFSLGTVMYAMCTGHPPFRATGTMAVLKRVIDETPRAIREINNEIPEWLCDIIARLHAKKPGDRFQSAKEVAEVLGQRLADVQAGRAVQAAPIRANEPTVAPEARSRRLMAALRIAVIAGLFVYAGVMLATGNLYAIQMLVAAAGIALLVLIDFVASRSWNWRRRVAALLVVFGVGFSITELSGLSRFFYAPSYPVALTSDDPGTRVRIWKWADDKPPTNLEGDVKILGKPAYRLANFATAELDLPAGNYLLVADLNGQEGDRQFIALGHNYFRSFHHLPGASWGGGAAIGVGFGGLGDRINGRPHRSVTIAAAANLAEVKEKQVGPRAIAVAPFNAEQAEGLQQAWVQLFNGNDLTGWHKHPDQPGNWRVEDGAITGSGPGTHSHLFSDRDDYEDFHLRAEVRINFFRNQDKVAFGNSGIYFRAGKKLDLDEYNRYPRGYEAQIFAGEATPSGAKERNRTGSLYGIKPYEKIIKGADAGDWFTMEIVARGPRITIKVNGLTTVDEFYDTTYRRGHLALQQAGAGTIVNFRKIEIRELPPSTVAPAVRQTLIGLVAAKERILAKVKLAFEAKGSSNAELLQAREDLLEAQARLAQAEGDAARVAAAMAEITALWKQERELIQRMVKQGAAPAVALDKFDARIAEAKTRLVAANIHVPAEAHALPKKAADIPRFVAGAWKIDSVIVVPKMPPAQAQMTGFNIFEPICGGKFLRGYSNYGDGQFESLMVQRYDQANDSVRGWFFSSRGENHGPGVGRWNPDTRSMLWLEKLPSGLHAAYEFQFADENTIKTRVYYMKDAIDNQIVFELRGTGTRLPGPVEVKPAPIDPNRPVEMKIFDQFVGDWQTAGNVKMATKKGLEGFKFTTRLKSQHILGGRMIATDETGLPGHEDSYWLMTYDTSLKAYRSWMFTGTGDVLTLGGGWDEKSGTLKWNQANPDGSIASSTWKQFTPDRWEWTTLIRDPVGKTLFDIQATKTRRK
jgi:hypothetical protein